MLPYSPDTLSIHSCTCIPFHRINNPVLAFFHNRHMIRYAVAAPVKEHQRARCGRASCRLLFSLALEPGHSIGTQRKSGHCPAFNEPCLFPAPADKAGAPLLIGTEPIPAPVLLAVAGSDLTFCDRHDLLISEQACKQIPSGIVSLHMGYILRISIS